jgi:hypothetical protein
MHSLHKKIMMHISAFVFQYQTIHLAFYPSYQFQINQYHPNQSTIGESGETFTKKQKVKHAASIHTFHGAASGRYKQEKSVLRKKTNMRYQMQMTRVREGEPGI